ncbi:MAG: HI0074 family nucleotidyltransferase substrate-binding subunit [Pseudomonadota bacterium]
MSELDKEVMEAKLLDFAKALERFSDALLLPKDTGFSYLDTSAHRFMLCYELTWKNLARFLSFRGIEAKSPVSVFREAYQEKLIDNKEIFAEMVKDRNIVTHEYFQEKAEEIYIKLPTYLEAMRSVHNKIEYLYKNSEMGL